MAQPDPRVLEQLNLDFIKRRDPDVEQILGSSAHVAMYVMSVDQQKWERRNLEGTLYVLKRRTNPRFQMMVLNKLNAENYLESIEGGFHAEVSPPYLIYTQGGGKVHGIWFYDESDLTKISGLLQKVEAGLPKQDGMAPTPQAARPAAGAEAAAEDDAQFWDKPGPSEAAAKQAVAAAPLAPFSPEQVTQAGPLTPTGNALTNLFKNAQAKQQQQQQQAVVPPVAAAPTAPGGLLQPQPPVSVQPLPPSFFLQQQQTQQPQSRPAPVAQPPVVGPPLERSATLPGADSGADSALSKLFAKQTLQQPVPVHASASQSGALAALLTTAATRAASVPAAPQSQPPPGRSAAPTDKLRTALTRLVQREEFLGLLAEELRGVGLLQ